MAQVLVPIIGKMKNENYSEPGVALKVRELKPAAGNKYHCTLTDSVDDVKGIVTSQLAELVTSGQMQVGSIIQLQAYTLNKISEELVAFLTSVEILQTPDIKSEIKTEEGAGAGEARAKDASATPSSKTGSAADREMKENRGINNTPCPTPPPSEEGKAKFAKTPSNMTPGAAAAAAGGYAVTPRTHPTPPMSSRKNFHRIEALHPYDDQWCIRAKLSRKYPSRTINAKTGSLPLFSVELIDDSGRQIQGTFWRGQVERYQELLQEGKVYVFSKFQVKPSNKAYSSVKNDYEIHFSDRTEVMEAADQDVSSMTAAVEVVPIDQLPKYITRKSPVDVLGVVMQVGTLGTIKRKSDSTELARRDVTLADSSGRSVVLTLWGENATDKSAVLEGREGALLQATACRVTDYNGCSLSTLTRSDIVIDPDTPAARELKEWYNAAGGRPTVTPVGQDLPGARGSGEGGSGGRNTSLVSLKEVAPAPGAILPAPDAKPTYHNVVATVSVIKTDQTMFYLANPENGRKVVEQDGRFYSEFEGKYIDRAEHRYVFTLKAVDASGDLYVNVYNDKGAELLGRSADELASLKASDEAAYSRAIRSAQWGEWSMTLKSRTREYQGETRMRHEVFNLKPISYVAESQRLLELISKY